MCRLWGGVEVVSVHSSFTSTLRFLLNQMQFYRNSLTSKDESVQKGKIPDLLYVSQLLFPSFFWYCY